MAEQYKGGIPDESPERDSLDLADLTNVTPIRGRKPGRMRPPPPSDEEIAEYRRIRPMLLKMIKEWDQIKSSQGCPVARQILRSD